MTEELGKCPERHDEDTDFLDREYLLEGKFKCVRRIEAAFDTDPNIVGVR